jgi:hypothetical protein
MKAAAEIYSTNDSEYKLAAIEFGELDSYAVN